MNPSLREEIAQAVVRMLRKEKAPAVANPSSRSRQALSDSMARVRKLQSGGRTGDAPIEVGDVRGGGTAAMVQNVLDEMRSIHSMKENGQATQLLGFGDPNLAPAVASALASVLGEQM